MANKIIIKYNPKTCRLEVSAKYTSTMRFCASGSGPSSGPGKVYFQMKTPKMPKILILNESEED